MVDVATMRMAGIMEIITATIGIHEIGRTVPEEEVGTGIAVETMWRHVIDGRTATIDRIRFVNAVAMDTEDDVVDKHHTNGIRHKRS